MRILFLILTIFTSYLMLQGWSGAPNILIRSILALLSLFAGFLILSYRRQPEINVMRNSFRINKLDYIAPLFLLLITGIFWVYTVNISQQPLTKILSSISPIDHTTEATEISDNQNSNLSAHNSEPGSWLFNNDLQRNLPLSTNDSVTDRTEAYLELPDTITCQKLLATRIHLQSCSLTRFNGVSWLPKPFSPITHTNPIRFQQKTPPSVIPHQVYLPKSTRGLNLFVALNGAHNTGLKSLEQVGPSIYLLPDLTESKDGYVYSATANPISLSTIDDLSIQSANDKNDSDALELPPNLEKKILETSAPFQNLPTTREQLDAIREYLQNNFTYSLETTNSLGKNPLENFLYFEKRGACEHYATAAAMLCRAVGIPSRISYGWSGGKHYPSKNLFVFKSRDAHAWTEVHLQGYGWVTFDTTPPDQNTQLRTETSSAEETPPDPVSEIRKASKAAQTDTFSPILRYTAVALSILLIASLALLYYRSSLPRSKHNTHLPARLKDPSYLALFKSLCTQLQHPMAKGKTLQQQIDSLEKHGISLPFAQQLVDYHYGVTYAELAENPSVESQLRLEIRRYKKHHSDSTTTA